MLDVKNAESLNQEMSSEEKNEKRTWHRRKDLKQ
jgi:hypothetical protein